MARGRRARPLASVSFTRAFRRRRRLKQGTHHLLTRITHRWEGIAPRTFFCARRPPLRAGDAAGQRYQSCITNIASGMAGTQTFLYQRAGCKSAQRIGISALRAALV